LGKNEYDLATLLTVEFSNVSAFFNPIYMKELSSPKKGVESPLTLHIEKQKKKIPYIVIFS